MTIKFNVYKYITLTIMVLSQIFFVTNVYARIVTVNGKVVNSTYSEVRPVIRAYSPGLPYYDGSPNKWKFLSEAIYDKSSGDFTIDVDVPDYENNIVLSAAYLSIETDVIKWVNTANTDAIEANITLPTKKNNDLSLKVNISISGIPFDYINNSASCMIVSKGIVENGRLMLMGVYETWLHKFTAYGLPDGAYRIACSVKNTANITVNNQVSTVLKRYKEFTLPLEDQDNIIHLDFSKLSSGGSTY